MAKGRVFRWMLYLVLALVVVLAALIGLVGSAFVGLRPAPDSAELPGGALLVKDGFSNVFILPTGVGKVALIDCGMDPQAKAVAAALKGRGLGTDAVEAVFITHGHGDHTGGCKAFPQAQLYALAAEVGLIEGTASVKSPMSGFTTPAPKATGLKVAKALADDETTTIGSLTVRALSVPGHTPGSAAYLAGQVLYLGDAASITDKGELRNAAWVFSNDTGQADRSLKALAGRLQGQRVQMVAPAHSGTAPATVLGAYAAKG